MSAITAALIAFAIAVSSNSGVPTASEPGELAYGDRGPWVVQLNARLIEAGFNPDGGSVFGKRTRHAVYAFQKHHGLPTTGKFTPLMWDLLEARPELPWRSDADRIEVDLKRQVLYVVEANEVVVVIPISSGNGATYLTEQGSTERARTPEGVFRFQRRITGWREAFLGQMWNPYYFWRGYAIHGSLSVPNYPASHGCIRVTMWDMDLLLDYFEVGLPVYIYGKRTVAPPQEVQPKELTPRFV